MSQTTNINNVLFAPPNGDNYQVDDYKILCKTTPIPIGQLPHYLLNGKVIDGWIPPFLVLAWPDQDHLVKILREQFPDCIDFSWEDPDSEPTEDLCASLLNMLKCFASQFDIPWDGKPGVLSIWNSKGEKVLALSVGDNASGLVSLEKIGQLADTYFGGEMPGWYLQSSNWTWRRSRRH